MAIRQCTEQGCKTQASFGLGGTTKRLFCKKHKHKDHVSLVGKTCHFSGCENSATFGDANSKTRLFCKLHKEPQHVLKTGRECAFQACINQARYKDSNLDDEYFCGLHRRPHHVPSWKTCQVNDCPLAPSFGLNGQKLSCEKHRLPDYISMHASCMAENCCTQPTFAAPASHQATYCGKHKPNNYVVPIRKQCINDKCHEEAKYAQLGFKTPIYCSYHRPNENGIQVRKINRTLCRSFGCTKRPSFGEKDTTKELFCREHKLIHQVEIYKRICIHEGCTTSATFGELSDNIRLFCRKHKENNHASLTKNTPQSKRLCSMQSCNLYASWGLPGQIRTTCKEHRVIGSVANPRKRCISPSCTELALYGEFNKPLHCEHHIATGEVDIFSKTCISCNLPNLLGPNSKCELCDENFLRKSMVKQNYVKKYLDEQNIQYLTSDRMLQQGICGKERPDFFIEDGLYANVYGEVDEGGNSHSRCVTRCICPLNEYACSCDIARMKDISQGTAKAAYFIRLNPDQYKDNDREQVSMDKRLQVFADWIKYLKELANSTPPANLISCVYLYFDHWTGLGRLECIEMWNNKI